ncbi:MAG: HPr family phosphocarrier protein [Lachnospiraceae bacterium]|nr:HPr family phosphocarrier protein [Lachnospiraceae bacterium]
MREETFDVINPTGLHMRPAAVLAKQAAGYDCEVSLVYKGKEMDAKSVLNIMAANIQAGSQITLICNGSDEDRAIGELGRQIREGLGEKS